MSLRIANGVLAGLLAVGIAYTAGKPASAYAQQKQFDGVTLRVGTWGAAWKESQEKVIAKKFAEVGGKVEFVTGSPQANLAKLVASRGQLPFDMMEILDAQEGDFKSSSFLAPIDLQKIPNKSLIQPYQYSTSFVGTWYTQEGICYSKPKYSELGLAPPEKFQDLVNPKLERKVLLPDINSGGGLAFVGAIAHATGGDEKNIAAGLELVTRIKPIRFWSQGSDMITQFQTGDIFAAVAHNGWCFRAAKAGAPVAFAHPEIKAGTKGIAKVGWMGIMKGSANIEAAHWYINEYLDPDFQFEFAVLAGVVPISLPALKRISEVPVMRDMTQTDPAAMAKELRIDYSKVNVSDWTDAWNRSVTRSR